MENRTLNNFWVYLSQITVLSSFKDNTVTGGQNEHRRKNN